MSYMIPLSYMDQTALEDYWVLSAVGATKKGGLRLGWAAPIAGRSQWLSFLVISGVN